MSNILAFPGAPPSFVRTEPAEFREKGRPGRKLGTQNMHTFVFRSYDLIVQSDEGDLVRDVGCDIAKAETKLGKIREQLQRNRELAAAREKLLTTAENKLSAAIEAAGSLPSMVEPLPEVNPRRTNSEAMAQRRKFGEAMRRRIRIIAVYHDLSADEIQPALTLKHREIARFCEQHGVRLEWLLEGEGHILKKPPAGPPMSSAEFAAVMKTLPEAQQEKIETLIDLFLTERGR